jgi:hypothetical protein
LLGAATLLVVWCVGDYPMGEFRTAIEQAAAADGFEPGMRVLVDGLATITLSRDDLQRDAYLARLAPPGAPLNAALFTSGVRIHVALRTLTVIGTKGSRSARSPTTERQSTG